MPAALGANIMLIVALIVKNISKTRKYPEFWFSASRAMTMCFEKFRVSNFAAFFHDPEKLS
jgi:hypothetical protein